METITISVRVDKSLWDAFREVCYYDDNTASRVLRAAMRAYIEVDNGEAAETQKRKAR